MFGIGGGANCGGGGGAVNIGGGGGGRGWNRSSLSIGSVAL
jgi:hypothetical protein